MTSFYKDINPGLVKRPLASVGRLVNRGLTSLVKKTNGGEWKTRVRSRRPCSNSWDLRPKGYGRCFHWSGKTDAMKKIATCEVSLGGWQVGKT